MSDSQIARLYEDNVKTEPPVEATISQSKPLLQITDVGPSHDDEASAAIPTAEHQKCDPSQPSRTSTRNKKQPGRFGQPMSTHLLKKGGREDVIVSKKHKNSNVFFIKVSKNKRRICLTTFIVMSISKGHKVKLDSFFLFWRNHFLINLLIRCQK